MSGEEVVHLFLVFALALGVGGQDVAGEGQGVAAGVFLARQKKDISLTHDQSAVISETKIKHSQI